MMRITPRFVQLVVVFAVMGQANLSIAQPTDHHSQLTEADQTGSMSADLFIVRYLEHVLATWKSPYADPSELGAWVDSTRMSLSAITYHARHHGCDPRVAGACNDVSRLLDTYDGLRRDSAFVDLITEVARPTQALVFGQDAREWLEDSANAAAVGGALGSLTGGVIGLVGGPGGTAIGFAAGAKIGAACGGVIGVVGVTADRFIDTLGLFREDVSQNERIDQSKRRTLMRLVDIFQGQFKSINDLLHTKVVPELAHDYAWKIRIGFDASLAKQYSGFVPSQADDPYLCANWALTLANSDAEVAIALCETAARSVPKDLNPDIDSFDEHRAAFLLLGARIALNAAERNSSNSADLARSSVRLFRDARSCLNPKSESIPLACRRDYAWALALAGLADEAEAAGRGLVLNANSDAMSLLDYAGILSEIGKLDDALSMLKRSFAQLPRAAPFARSDPRFRNLAQVRQSDLEQICNPQILGIWTFSGGQIGFYPDGTFYQKASLGGVKRGTYEILSHDQIRITTIESKVLWFAIDGDSLSLRKPNTLDCRREPSIRIGKWRNPDAGTLELFADGRWSATRNGQVTSGSYAVVNSGGEGVEQRLLLSTDSILDGDSYRILRHEINGDTMKIWNPLETVFRRVN